MIGQRWLARLSILLAVGAIAVLLAFAGRRSVGLIVASVIGASAAVAGAYWFLARRGLARWLAFTLAVLAPAGVTVAFVLRGLLWVAALADALLLLAFVSAHAAMGRAGLPARAERRAGRPSRPFLIMNPRSGGGKVAKFRLKDRAESLGAEVAMLEGPGIVDVEALARQAVADGADLLGVAGGDGTQALVAGIAAEFDLPFLCISAGTRNHFAMDLGLDRDDPSTCLAALTDGLERRIDLGLIGDRIFVNNASFGAYAEVVRSPAYRDDKRGTTLELLPDLLGPDGGGHRLRASVGSESIDGPQALLVSNNPYELNDVAGLGRRVRLDSGALGVIGINVDNAAEAIGLLRHGKGHGLTILSGPECSVSAEQAEIPVGVDGESILLKTPVSCSVLPGALRVVVPRDRPGVRAPRVPFTWSRLAHLAAFGGQVSI